MDGARNELLPRSAFAGYEDRGIQASDSINERVDTVECFALSD
jgi:hypothetical protein